MATTTETSAVEVTQAERAHAREEYEEQLSRHLRGEWLDRRVILGEGMVRVVLTDTGRLFVVLHVDTALGRIKTVIEVEPRSAAENTAGIFDDIGDFVSDAADTVKHTVESVVDTAKDAGGGAAKGIAAVGKAAVNAAEAAAKAVASVAEPALTAVRHIALDNLSKIALVGAGLPTPLAVLAIPAAKIIAKGKLGDLDAKTFVEEAVKAAGAGAPAVADALVQGGRLLDVANSLPVEVAKALNIPIVNKVIGTVEQTIHSMTPEARLGRFFDAIKSGNWDAVKDLARTELSNIQGAISVVPGIGTGVSAAISAGLAVLDGGNPLEIALRTAYGALPIPPGIRPITDAVLTTVLGLVGGQNITDLALAVARDHVPEGLPRDVFDTLVQIVIRRIPIQKVGEQLAEHYIKEYGGAAVGALGNAIPRIPVPDVSKLLPKLPTVPPVVNPGAAKKILQLPGLLQRQVVSGIPMSVGRYRTLGA